MSKHNISVLFWLFKAKENSKGLVPLYLRITYNYQRKNIATGYFIEVNKWDSAKGRVKGTAGIAQEINSSIQHTKSRLFSLYNEMLKEKIFPFFPAPSPPHHQCVENLIRGTLR